MKRMIFALSCTALWVGGEYMLHSGYGRFSDLYPITLLLHYAAIGIAMTSGVYLFVDGAVEVISKWFSA